MSFKKSTYPLIGLIEEFAKLNWIALRGVKNDSRTEDSANISQTLYLLTKKKKRAKRERSTRGGIVEFATEGPHPYPVSLPVCACVQFSYDSFRGFNDRIKYTRSVNTGCEQSYDSEAAVCWNLKHDRHRLNFFSKLKMADTGHGKSFVPIDSWWQIIDINDAIIIYQWLDFYGASITHRLFIEFWQYLMSNQLIAHWLKQDKSD